MDLVVRRPARNASILLLKSANSDLIVDAINSLNFPTVRVYKNFSSGGIFDNSMLSPFKVMRLAFVWPQVYEFSFCDFIFLQMSSTSSLGTECSGSIRKIYSSGIRFSFAD